MTTALTSGTGVSMGTAVGYLKLNASGFTAGVNEAEQSLGGFQTRLKTAMTDLQSAGESISRVGTMMTIGLTVPIMAAGKQMLSVAADFQKGMSQVEAVSGATSDEMERLTAKAKEMGIVTAFSASDAAEALKYMSMAGWDAEQMLDGIEAVMNGAAASGEELGLVADIVTDALTAFGLKASDAGKFMDVLAMTSNASNTSISMLGASFKYIAPLAGSLNYSVEDISVSLGLMANNGIKAEQAGTTLRAALSRLVDPSKEAMQGLSDLNLVMNPGTTNAYNAAILNADGTMKSWSETLAILRESFSKLTEAEKAKTAANIFGQEAMSGMLALINSTTEDTEKLTKAVANSEGTSKKMADIMMDNVAGALDMVKSSIEGVYIAYAELLMPKIQEFLEKAAEILNYIESLDDGTKMMILKVVALTAAIGPALAISGKFVSVIASFAGAFGGALLPIAGLVAALALVGTAIASHFGLIEGLPDLYKKGVSMITSFIQGLIDKLPEILEVGLEIVVELADGILQALPTLIEALPPLIIGIVDFLLEAIPDIQKAGFELFSVLLDDLPAILESLAQGIIDIVTGIVASFVEHQPELAQAGYELFTSILDDLPKVLEEVAIATGKIVETIMVSMAKGWAKSVTDLFIESLALEMTPDKLKRIVGIDLGILPPNGYKPTTAGANSDYYPKIKTDENNEKEIEDTKKKYEEEEKLAEEHNNNLAAIEDEAFAKEQENNQKSLDAKKAKFDELRILYENNYDVAVEKIKEESEKRIKSIEEISKYTKAAHEEKMAMYEKEYIASIGKLDLSTNAKVKSYQSEIDAIKNLGLVEAAENKRRLEENKLTELSQAVLSAKTAAEALAASKEYNEEKARQDKEANEIKRASDIAALNQKIADTVTKAKEEKAKLEEIYKEKIAAEKEEMLKHEEWKTQLLEKEIESKEKAIKKESDYLNKWLRETYVPVMDSKLEIANKRENMRHDLVMVNLKEEAKMVAGISQAMQEATNKSSELSGLIIDKNYVSKGGLSYSGNDGYVPNQDVIQNGLTVKPNVTNNYNIKADGKSAVEIADEVLKQQTLAAEGIE